MSTELKAVQIQGITSADLINKFKEAIKPLIHKPQPQTPDDVLMTRKEVAKYLGVSLVTLHNWTKGGVLISYRIGNQVRYKRHEVIQSLQAINSKNN